MKRSRPKVHGLRHQRMGPFTKQLRPPPASPRSQATKFKSLEQPLVEIQGHSGRWSAGCGIQALDAQIFRMWSLDLQISSRRCEVAPGVAFHSTFQSCSSLPQYASTPHTYNLVPTSGRGSTLCPCTFTAMIMPFVVRFAPSCDLSTNLPLQLSQLVEDR